VSVLLLAAILLAACQAGVLAADEPEPVSAVESPAVEEVAPEIEEIAPEVEEAAQDPPHISGLTWLVPPTFAYEQIRHCWLCGFFTRPDWMLIDEGTGAALGYKEGHGGSHIELFYDESLDLFGEFIGMHVPTFHPLTRGEFLTELSMFVDTFNLFHGIDTTRIIHTNGVDGPPMYDFSQARTGVAALAVGVDFLGWFEFDGDEWQATFERGLNIIAVKQGDYWGVIDHTGSVIIPFVFDHVIPIDEHTAFAKYGGLYGILQLS